YDSIDIFKTNDFEYACYKFNNIMGIPYIQFGCNYNLDNTLADWSLSFIFSVVELQYENLSNNDGKMIKIDAQQFECDLKAKVLEQMKELKDAEPKFQSAYTELTTAIEAFEKGDYQSAINNSGKSYESVLKVILNADRGNVDKLTNKYMSTFLEVPETMKKEGFREKVMMSLPYVRNNSGADHGAGAKEVVISNPMAKLAINLAAALDTYLIEEYEDRIIQNPETKEYINNQGQGSE
ncbi:MAG: abortive infection family protein, partial [Ruminococcus sp.]|nr:abortive infection family protein [Ruminococcus sp.]